MHIIAPIRNKTLGQTQTKGKQAETFKVNAGKRRKKAKRNHKILKHSDKVKPS